MLKNENQFYKLNSMYLMRRFNATNVQNGHRFFFGKLQIHSKMHPLRFVCNISGVICVISCLIRCLRFQYRAVLGMKLGKS
jgi:hypothetical protein